MTTETESGLPPQAANAEQDALQVEQQQASTEATTEQEQEQRTEEVKDEGKKEPWFQKRIGELTREKYEARREAETMRRQVEEIQRYLAQQAQQSQGEQEQPNQRQPQIDVERLAMEKAEQLLSERRLAEATDRVWSEGVQLPGFQQAVNNLAMLGMGRDFIETVIESDHASKVLHYLGQESHLEEAERILKMPPAQQGRALAQLEYKLSQPPAPKPVSKAPAPISPIGAGGATETGVRDDLPIDEWMRRERERTRRKS